MDMDICSNSEIICSFPQRCIYDCNNTSFVGFENFNDSYKKSDLLCNRNNYKNQTFSLFPGNENSFPLNFQGKNDLSKDEIINQDQIYFIPFSKNNNNNNLNNLNINTKITLKSLDDDDESKTNQLLEVKKELPPKFFREIL